MRSVAASEIDQLARLWHDGWHDAHARFSPAGLVQARTLPRFRERLAVALAETRVTGPVGAPLGLCMLKDDELNQLYVAREARGAGVAAILMADGEARLAARGLKIAWLACAVGNDRAARFYEKSGWYRARTLMSQLETPDGTFALEIWRYEKALA